MSLSRYLRIALAVIAAGGTVEAQQQTVPVLRYEPPANFMRGGSTQFEDYTARQFNASIQVYPFQPAPGNIQQVFQRTLLRDWIDIMHKEENVAGQPRFTSGKIPGSDLTITASFAENRVGIGRPHLRVLILARGYAALVDASSPNVQTWQRLTPTLERLGSTLRVESEAAPPALTDPGPVGDTIAGLYKGIKQKYTVNLNASVGYGNYVTALHFYLLSAHGRVYRAYDQLVVPGGDVNRFDFDAAERRDPRNSGSYGVSGNKLRIHIVGPPAEDIITTIPDGGQLTVNKIVYTKQ